MGASLAAIYRCVAWGLPVAAVTGVGAVYWWVLHFTQSDPGVWSAYLLHALCGVVVAVAAERVATLRKATEPVSRAELHGLWSVGLTAASLATYYWWGPLLVRLAEWVNV